VVGNLADAYRWSGRPEDALATYEKAIELAYKELEVNPRSAAAMSSLALYYAKKGDPSRGQGFIRRARSIDENNVEYLYIEAVVAALAGRDEEALLGLRRAFENGYAVEEALSNPELADLQDLPEFAALISDFQR
jgi:tetratricopeptide (TPR) repeat protein